jgi:hypothetical protein
LRCKEFCAARGLSAHTLEAWRRRIAEFGSGEKIAPVEIVEDRRGSMGPRLAGSVGRSGQFLVVLTEGLGIEVEPSFDAAELRRLVATPDGGP